MATEFVCNVKELVFQFAVVAKSRHTPGTVKRFGGRESTYDRKELTMYRRRKNYLKINAFALPYDML